MTLSSRSPLGQAAAAVYKLDQIAQRLAGFDLDSISVSIHVEKADEGLGDFVRARLAETLPADRFDVTVDNLDVQNAQLLIDEEFEIASEVNEFWDAFRFSVLPRVHHGQGVVIDALLSEPPQVRSQIEQQAMQELLDAGADPESTAVTVLSAYKQGYSWLYDAVRPALDGQRIDTLIIRFAEIGPPEEWPQQAMYTPTRWLLEIFPIDEVLARELSIDLRRIRFDKMPIGSATYEVIAIFPYDGGEAGGRKVIYLALPSSRKIFLQFVLFPASLDAFFTSRAKCYVGEDAFHTHIGTSSFPRVTATLLPASFGQCQATSETN